MGEFSWVSLAAANPAVPPRVTLFGVGVSSTSGGLLAHREAHQYAPVASLKDAVGLVVRTATFGEILGKLTRSFLAKIDIDGGEIEVLRGYLASSILVDNMIVELTPMWWSTWGYSFEQGAAVVTKLLETHDAHVIFWREASMMCCRSIFDVTPGIDWSSAPLGYVQRISAEKVVPYLRAMHSPDRKHTQRDFWFAVKGQVLHEVGEIRDLRCDDPSLYADAFGNAPCARRHETWEVS